jgi:predicted metal-dependent TIM-barrel fold hydrolase
VPQGHAPILEGGPGRWDRRDRIILGSELGYGGAGHLSLVKVAWVMKMEGMTRKDIEFALWENPKNIFNLPIQD